MSDSDLAPDISLLKRLLPDACGVLVYTRAGSSPWEIRESLGDAPGVLGAPSQALREVWSELVHPEDEAGLLTTLASLGAGQSSSVDYRVRTAAGGERWVRDSMRRLPGQGGSGVILGVVRDLTAERSLGAQAAGLEERIYRAQRVDSLGGLAAGIAHDLGNLLTAILSAVHSLETTEDLGNEEVREDLLVIRESARRGAEFVKQILRFAAREEYRPGLVDLNAVVEDLRIILGRSLGEDIGLVVETAPELPQIHCDPGQMEQILLNLAVNGREAMPKGGELKITTQPANLQAHTPVEGGSLRPGEYIVLTVSDTGQGIPTEVRSKIFEPLFSTKESGGTGSGFGLSTVQRIVHARRGGIRVESREGSGTTFKVYLPVRPPSPGPRELPEIAGPSSGGEPRGRVLVVEADLAVRDVMKRVLAREHFTVMAVGSHQDALRLFDRVRPPFDLLVTALSLPDRSGGELAHLLRNRIDDLPLVCVSGAQSDPEPMGLDEPGAVRLEKPFLPSQLIAAIERALTWPAERRSSGA